MKRYCVLIAGVYFMLLAGVISAQTQILLYPVSWMARIIDTQRPSSEQARQMADKGKITLFAAPGECEPAAFVIYPDGGDMKEVGITVSDLKSTDGKNRIPYAAIDPYIVKCWYADIRDMWGTVMKKEYWPELLVKNENIIQVDHLKKENILKFDELPVIPNTLQPFNVASDSIKEILLLVHVPENVPAGTYKGMVTVSAGLSQAKIPMEIEVLNIALNRPLADIGAFITESVATAMGFDYFKLEMADMAAHGFNFAYIWHPRPDYEKNDFSGLKNYLDAYRGARILSRRAVLDNTGLTQDIWAASSIKDNELPQKMQEEIRTRARKLKMFLTSYDPNIEWYIYGMDEKAGDELKRGSRAQKIIREEGLKIMVATNQGDENLDYNLWFTYVWFVHHGMRPTVADYHEKGKRFGLYTPMSHFKDTVLYRYRAGFSLWNQPLDGYIPWSYMDNIKDQWKQVSVGKQSAWGFVYPATNGLIPTLQWEGFREGADDYRYVTTLAMIVEKAHQMKLKDPLLEKAEKILTRVDIQPYNITTAIQYLNPTQADYTAFSDKFPYEKLQEARKQIADLILALQTRFPTLSTFKLKNDRKLEELAYRRKLERFSISRFHAAHDEANKYAALEKEFKDAAAKRDWAKAGPLAQQLKEKFEANKAIWDEQGFLYELPREVSQVLDEYQKISK